MPSTSVELYERIKKHVEDVYQGAYLPQYDMLIGHAEVKSYCEEILTADGFTIKGGWMTPPEKYNKTVCLSDEDEICDALQYLIEEWDYALTCSTT